MKPISVGNVVSAGLRIYRDHFRDYFRIAFFGYLWALVPVYGWAKFSAAIGLISRLAFGEITERPESIRDANRQVKPKMWSFLGAGILVSFIFFGAMIAFSIVFGIIFGIITAILGVVFGQNPNLALLLGVLLTIVGILVFIFGFIWLISRLFMVELSLAIEENVNATGAIGRSWQLTKGSVFRLQLIVLLAFLISFPVVIVIQIASVILQLAIGSLSSSGSGFLGLLLLLTILAITIAGGALMIPFWQAIKAVIYYDLRVRREGFGMEIREDI